MDIWPSISATKLVWGVNTNAVVGRGALAASQDIPVRARNVPNRTRNSLHYAVINRA